MVRAPRSCRAPRSGAWNSGARIEGGNSAYRGSQGLPPELVARIEKQFGFDKPPLERFLSMMGNYLRFDFGESYFRDISVQKRSAALERARSSAASISI